MSTLIEQARAREWFYAYDLPDGSSTSTYHDAAIHAIHDTRWQMLESYLDRSLGTARKGLSALDLACHQGWFAVNMARAGFSPVATGTASFRPGSPHLPRTPHPRNRRL